MKTLVLMRHAKSAWANPQLTDSDRPLNKRGLKAAPAMGKLIRNMGLSPQYVLCSTSLRTRQTAEAVLRKCQFNGEIKYLESLYLGAPQAYLDALHKVPDPIDKVLVVGHNTGMEEFLEFLTGRFEKLPTAAVVHLILHIDRWEQLNATSGTRVIDIWKPRKIAQ